MSDLESDMQRRAEEHLEACQDAMGHLDEQDTDHECDDTCPKDPSFGPFCGCNTCIVREVLSSGYASLKGLVAEDAQ